MSATKDANGSLVAGADGCRAGWICVMAQLGTDRRLRLLGVELVADFAALLSLTQGCAALAVDIPIGLSHGGSRRADFAARRRIGPRRSSVFPAPARLLLTASSYVEANAVSRATLGKGLSAQAFGIMAKIREVDQCMRPQMQNRVVESHPEVCFWALGAENPLLHPKRRNEGAEERLRLLETVYGPSVGRLTPPRGAQRDDLYDACVLAWSASRVAEGTAVHLPGEAQRDERGLRMEIVY
jgi:predicted RNase H-like nuclease